MLLQRLANTCVKNIPGLQESHIGSATKACKYCCYKTITSFQEPQNLMLLRRLANTSIKN